MNISVFLHDMGYVFVAFLAIYFTGWLVYDKVLTKGHSISQAIFEKKNMAAGLEIMAFLFMEVMIAVSAMSGDEIRKMAENGVMVIDYWRDVEAVFVTIVFSNLAFFVLRGLGAAVIARLYRGIIDHQGDIVDYNNEIFSQGNVGAALFSCNYLLIMYFMIVQEDFLNIGAYQMQSYFNMLAVFLTGVLVYVVHNVLFMKKGHTTLDELFMDNNMGVGLSLSGLMFGILFLQNRLMHGFTGNIHFFNGGIEVWGYFVVSFVYLIVMRMLFTSALSFFSGKNFDHQFLVEDNPVVGLLDMTFVTSSAILFSMLL